MATSKKTGLVKPKKQTLKNLPKKQISVKKVIKLHRSQKGLRPGISKQERLKAIVKTEQVTYFVQKHIVPLVVEKLKKATKKSRVVSASEIINSIYKNHGIKLRGYMLRSILHYIRINGIVKCLLACSTGYFITNDTMEMQVYLKSLTKRMRQIGALKTALDRQGHEVLGKQISTTKPKNKIIKNTKKKHGK